MPLLLDKRYTPTHWMNSGGADSQICADQQGPGTCLRVALVNNMPDSAIEDTEAQFFALLDSASEHIPVRVELFSLPGIPRSERAQQHLNAFYQSTEQLLNQRFDGVIITGTEPRQPDLRQEPYWRALTQLFGWAEHETTSAVLSCLAAHAGVLFSDGISRRPIGEKRFGVFEHEIVADHSLVRGVESPVRIPHSRWNELDEHALRSAGYTTVTRSPEAGVDLFIKQKKRSLFVHFQGHPEYAGKTPFKEYRRDVRRYLRKERETYPSFPKNYFDEHVSNLLSAFREAAMACRDERLMDHFPEAQFNGSLRSTWQSSASRLYRNWMEWLEDGRTESFPKQGSTESSVPPLARAVQSPS
jgi:homoserine O-succinyltransferase/O-acetyltransferase